jgi:hypothetical protein
MKSLLVALALAAAPALAVPAELQPNSREACRRAVAGAYLNAYGEKERLEHLIRATDAEIATTKSALAAARRELASWSAKAKAESFDVDLATKRDDAAVIVKGDEDQLKTYEQEMADAKGKLGAPVAEERRLRGLIDKVFVFERLLDQADGGYPIHLAYRSPCPKYRALCPLPPKDADRLLAITVDGQAPEPCSRYASLSKIP